MTQTKNPDVVRAPDEHPHPLVTVRRWHTTAGTLIRADVFVGGWRAGSYKTERGATKRAAAAVAAETNLEFRPWAEIPSNRKRGEGDAREVWGATFLGERAWLPWMGCDHPASERTHRTGHGYLGDYAAGEVHELCSGCGHDFDAVPS
jgi:hypothetical protein